MLRKISLIIFLAACMIIPANAGWLDEAVTGAVEQKGTEAVNEGVNSAVDNAKSGSTQNNQGTNTPKTKTKQQPANNTNTNTANDTGGNTSSTPVANEKSYQNYDFVPGDKIIFDDDFSGDSAGEWAAHWELRSGQGSVANIYGKKALTLTEGNYAKTFPLMKKAHYLGSAFTIEFDQYVTADNYNTLVFLPDSEDNSQMLEIGHTAKPGYFGNSADNLSGTYPGGDDGAYLNKWHHIAIAFKDGQIKIYIDQYRVITVPRAGYTPVALGFGGIGSPEAPIIIANVRVAEGGGMNMIKKLFTDGKLVTHGITFEPGSDKIRPESMGTLNQILAALKEDATVKLSIEGHTDNQGNKATSQPLSDKRAAAVKNWLTGKGIAADRLQTKGWGEAKPIDTNATAEGRANNRRVEFIVIK